MSGSPNSKAKREALSLIAASRIGPPESVIDRYIAPMADLPEREQLVIRKRINGETLQAIGLELGLTRERVRQLESRALKRFRPTPPPIG